MANRFYTLLVIPEKTSQVRRIVVPSWLLRGSLIGVFFLVILGTVMLMDYWFVMGQISENKQLKLENRRLRQQVQVFRNKMTTIESTMERVKTFATRLKVITNIEDRDGLIQSLNQKLPDAATNLGGSVATAPQGSGDPAATPSALSSTSGTDSSTLAPPALDGNPETTLLRKEYEELDVKFSDLNYETLLVEQTLQDQYELLADQKAFLAALPTRKPTVGYFTSGFGIRKSPYGGRDKMHEGVDIANYPGTPIKAPADGVVLFADSKPGYGQTVILDHGYGLETWYAHTRKITVSKGQKVRRGDAIALLGTTGRSTGPHLHYEVRVHGTPVDPRSYILEN
jgi:murein DD-endopeptidase MepM/ murein hydrolase activator NlpD